MLRLIQHYSDHNEHPISNPISKLAHSLSERPTYEPYFASLGGRKWVPIRENWYYTSMPTLSDGIFFVTKSKNTNDIGIFNIRTKTLITNKNTRHVLIMYDNQPVGYVNPEDPLHRVQMSFAVGDPRLSE